MSRIVHEIMILSSFAGIVALTGCRREHEQVKNVEPRVTYHADVAEIIRAECSVCHRQEGGAPFPLVTFQDAADRADQIADVVASGYMPPWPPDTKLNSFIDERSLTKEQIETLQVWAKNGAPAGAPSRTSAANPAPDAPSEWVLGAPDLIVSFERPFEVPAEFNEDIYRNFVIPIPVSESKYVNAIEIKPSNLQVAHHLFVRVDKSGVAKTLSGRNGKPGFDGMERVRGVKAPDGCILSWQVGKQPSREPDGVAWRLDPNSDFVIECHLQPTGKKELLDIRIGLHFTDSAPTRFPILANLRQLDIDIPPGEANYRTSMEYTLPVSATATAVLPHAHYLGKRLDGYAMLPSGERRELIRIQEWDFNWQGEYRYKEPLRLPAGTKLVMDYQFDNSAANPFNPNNPPKRVKYGPQSTDEMAELAFQLLPDSQKDYLVLARDFGRWRVVNELMPYDHRQLQDPVVSEDVRYRSNLNLAKAHIMLQQPSQAMPFLMSATRSPVVTADAFNLLGRISVDRRDLSNGRAYFQRGLELDAKNLDTLNGLGIIAMREKNYREGVRCFEEAIKILPSEVTVHRNLGSCLLGLKEYDSALKAFESALQLAPDHRQTQETVAKLRKLLNR